MTAEPTNGEVGDNDIAPAPLMEICIDLANGMHVRMDRCVGDVPLMEIITGRARLLVSVEASGADAIGPEHLALAEEFAMAACGFRDELRVLVERR
jgi:hypothetical protein